MPVCAASANSGAEPTTHSWSFRYSEELPRPDASVRYIWLLVLLSASVIISVAWQANEIHGWVLPCRMRLRLSESNFHMHGVFHLCGLTM